MTINGATEAAKEAIKGLSASPALLLIMLLNIAMLVGVGYVAKTQADERRELRADEDAIIKLLLATCNPRPVIPGSSPAAWKLAR